MTDRRALRHYRAMADYVAIAQIYLSDNVLLGRPLQVADLSPRLLGHWGTVPALNLIYAGASRLLRDLPSEKEGLLIVGSGHGAAAVHANLWLEGTHEMFDPALSRDAVGLRELCRRFSAPGAFPGNLAPEVPGTLYPGGEVGYALATAFGAALDAPERFVIVEVGDGEAETGATAAAWQSTKFVDLATAGLVLPVVNLNGYKIGSPTVLAALDDEELTALFVGLGFRPLVVDIQSDDPDEELARVFEHAADELLDLQNQARSRQRPSRPIWPVIVLRSPKGWGTVRESGGRRTEGTFHSHHLPIEDPAGDPEQLRQLEGWLRSYRPDELFSADGEPSEEALSILPSPDRRLGRSSAANGGDLRQAFPSIDLEAYAPSIERPDEPSASPTAVAAAWLRDVMVATEERRNFRIVCPDEMTSIKLDAVLDASPRAFTWPVPGYAEQLAPDGRCMEVLNEQLCQGWLEGYLRTGRYGLFATYEAFAEVATSMLNQHAKFLAGAAKVNWRVPVANLVYLLTNDGWRQEANGYTHAAPGFLQRVLSEYPGIGKVEMPPDAATTLVCLARAISGAGHVVAVVAGSQSSPVLFDLPAATAHVDAGIGIMDSAGTANTGRADENADVVLICAGTLPTREAIAAARMVARDVPGWRVRVVNVIDLSTLGPDNTERWLSAERWEELVGTCLPVLVAFHGYRFTARALLFGRPGAERFDVRGYEERGGMTTEHDLLLANGLSRVQLAAALLTNHPDPDIRENMAARYEREAVEIHRHAVSVQRDPDAIGGLRAAHG